MDQNYEFQTLASFCNLTEQSRGGNVHLNSTCVFDAWSIQIHDFIVSLPTNEGVDRASHGLLGVTDLECSKRILGIVGRLSSNLTRVGSLVLYNMDTLSSDALNQR
jgi:hypothetical protein